MLFRSFHVSPSLASFSFGLLLSIILYLHNFFICSFSFKLLFNCVVWGLWGLAGGTDLRGSWFGYKVSRCDGRRGTFSFYRKICKLAPILISGKFDKYFTFMPLALCDGTTAQLQICSSERNVLLLPVGWRKYN